jgi:hypothetical protein
MYVVQTTICHSLSHQNSIITQTVPDFHYLAASNFPP